MLVNREDQAGLVLPDRRAGPLVRQDLERPRRLEHLVIQPGPAVPQDPAPLEGQLDLATRRDLAALEYLEGRRVLEVQLVPGIQLDLRGPSGPVRDHCMTTAPVPGTR